LKYTSIFPDVTNTNYYWQYRNGQGHSVGKLEGARAILRRNYWAFIAKAFVETECGDDLSEQGAWVNDAVHWGESSDGTG